MTRHQHESAIEACVACAEACERCATACLHEPDVAAMADCIRLDRDCADLCRLAATFLARESELAGEVCRTCAEIGRAHV